MIEITVTMHGNLRRFLPQGQGSVTLDVPEGASLRQVIESLQAEHDTWLVAVNGTACPVTATVSDGDRVECFERLEGG